MFLTPLLSPLLTLTLTLSAFATPTKRPPTSGLVVSITSNTPSIDSIADLILTAKVTNTSPKDVKVIKYATVLDDTRPTRSFKVTKGGKDVEFVGVQLQVDLDAAGDDESAFALIPAHSSVSVNHTLASVYDFSTAGTGSFEFDPLVRFFTLAPAIPGVAGARVNAAAVDRLVTVNAESSSVAVEITHDVARRELASKRSTVRCENSSRAEFMRTSYTESRKLASLAAQYIRSHTGTGDALFEQYFKTNSEGAVAGRFEAIAGENDEGRGMYCSDPYDVCSAQDGGIIAYTWLATTEIYYCSLFFTSLPSTSLCSSTTDNMRKIRGGTTLHEFSHALSGTDDVNYGCPRNRELGKGEQMNNADNFNCFATEVYKKQC
ncbi:hypothetical protein BDV98DRAFT_553290 [Pterulicium gracile]|uniref:Neutral protease 2 n=1 Tax=Pterulicium gracile TaxID=1884261 RepID=A0A5C3QAA7_9AGAR|nr:hypothetical protein BDV98DRAFT_553290 [Pterula gracilis]